MAEPSNQPFADPLTDRRIVATWWPLAASWLLMSLEQPAANAVVARLADPKVSLAAWGSIVFPISLVVEAPIIMLLAASTALSKDWATYTWLRRFMLWAGAGLTALHLLVALTPLYYTVVQGLIGAPAEIVEPARIGLLLMTPWSWSIAYRRFNQGVLIRFGHSRAVGVGTLVRLGSEVLVLVGGYLVGTIPGVAVAGGAIAVGVMGEAVYTGLRVRPVLRNQVRPAPPAGLPPTWPGFLRFYVPLSMTSLLYLLVQPIGSAALSRMPSALDSLATWPVCTGLIFLLRSLGMAYNEVVVALLDQPGAAAALRRFTACLAGLTTAAMVLLTATPLAAIWFGPLSALSAPLVELARGAVWLALPVPGLNVLQSWFQGRIVHSGHTRAITEAVVIYLLASTAIQWSGVAWGQVPGLYVGLAAFSAGYAMQTAWLWVRSRVRDRKSPSAALSAGASGGNVL